MTEEYDDISKQIKTTDFSIAYKPPGKQIEFIDNLSAWENDEDIQEKGAIYLDYLAKNTTGWKKFLDAGSWGTNDDIIETLRDESFRLGTKAARATQLEEAPEEVKEAYKYLKKRYDTSSLGNSEQWYKAAAEISTDIIADPINLVGLLMSGGTAIGASMAGKSAITQVLKRLAVGESTKTSVISTALAGSAWSGLDNYADQQVELAVGLRDQFNNSELGTSLAFGAVVGGVLGLGAGKLRKKSVERAVDEEEAVGRAVADIDLSTFETATGFKDDVLNGIENKSFLEGDFEVVIEKVVNKYSSKVGGGEETKSNLRDIILETIKESQGPSGQKVDSKLGLKAKQFFHGYIPKATLVGKPAGILSAYSKFSKTAGVLQKKFRYDLGLGITAERKLVDLDFSETIRDIQGERWQDIKIAFEPIVLNAKNKVADDVNDEIIAALRSGTVPENKVVQNATIKIKQVLNDIGKDLNNLGLIDEPLENYFPRMWDRKAIENNPDAFKNLLISPQGDAPPVAKNLNEADEIMKSMLDIKNQVGLGGSSKSFFANRKFAIVDDTMFKDFIDNDINNVLLSYVTQTSKQIAKVKVFGVRGIDEFEKVWLNPIIEEMKEAGKTLSKGERNEILDIYKSATSEGLPRNSEAVENALDYYILGTRMALLPLATLSSLTEVVTNLAKAGVVNSLKGFGQATKASFKHVTYDLVERLGIESNLTRPETFKELNRHWLAMEQAAADTAERLAGDELTGKWKRKINDKFFRFTLLDQWTKFVQLTSFNTGKELIKDNLQRIAANPASKRASYLTDQLTELGVDIGKGLDWVSQGAKKTDEFYKDVQKGAARYTSEVILQPTAAAGMKPRIMSNPRTVILTQLMSYPAAYTNTILKNAAVGLIRDPVGNTPRTLAAALIMTEMARVGNYYRSHGESEKNKTPAEARLAAIARWGGNGLVLDTMQRARKSAEIYQSNVAYLAGVSPVTSDMYKLAKSGDVVSFLGAKVPGYAAFKTLGGEDFKDDYDTLTKELNKKLTKFLVPEKEKKISFATGGEVNIPNAPKEPDQRIDKMTGLPYDVQAGDAFIDNEDPLRRLGFKGGGFVTDPLKRLGFGAGGKVTKFLNESVQEIISNYSKKEIDPLTAEKAADDILEPFRGYEDMPGELDDPEFEDFIKATVKAQLEEKHGMPQETMRAKYPQFYDEKGVLKGGEEFSKARGYTPAEIKTFEIASELEAEFNAQDATAHINDVLNSVGATDISVPKDTSKALKDFYVQKEIAEDYETPIEKIEQKYQKEIKNLSPEEIEILQKLKQELPSVPERPVKQRKVDIEGRNKALKTFLSTSKYKKPVYRATHSGFDTDYEISFAMPREIGTHVGARGQASSIAIRAVQSPDSMMQKLTTEKEIAEQFALPQQQEKPLAITAGYINVSKPLEILEDFGNWGAYNILNDKKALDVFVDKISKQAFDGEGVSKDSVKARLNGLKKELDALIKTKQDKGEASFNYQVRDADLNIKFKNLLENFGFDSIKYKNKNEAVLKGEDPYSFILFNPTQFKSTYATRFDVGDPRQNFAEGGLLKKTIRKLNNV